MSAEVEDDLESLTRSELQQRAKALGIKANMKSTELIAAIRRLRVPPRTPKTPGQRKVLSPDDVTDEEESYIKRQSSSMHDLQNSSNLVSLTLNSAQHSNGEVCHRLNMDTKVRATHDVVADRHKLVDWSEQRSSISPQNQKSRTIGNARVNSPLNSENSQANSIPKPYDLKQAMRMERERRRSMKLMAAAANAWERVESRSKPGHFYYWNPVTQQTTWEIPTGF